MTYKELKDKTVSENKVSEEVSSEDNPLVIGNEFMHNFEYHV